MRGRDGMKGLTKRYLSSFQIREEKGGEEDICPPFRLGRKREGKRIFEKFPILVSAIFSL